MRGMRCMPHVLVWLQETDHPEPEPHRALQAVFLIGFPDDDHKRNVVLAMNVFRLLRLLRLARFVQVSSALLL